MALLKSLGWYRRRLAVMGPREIGHRLAEQAAVQSLRWQAPRAVRPPPARYAFCRAASPQLPALPWTFDASSALAAGLADGRWPALGCDWRWTGDAACWHRAPDTGRSWPVEFFASIPYRPGNPVGDVRVAWEPSRLQQLVALALVVDAGDERQHDALGLLEAQFLSWLAANPPYRGIHYVSAMECALRLIAACHALDTVRGRLVRRDEVWSGLVALVSSHATLVARRLSLHSSAGNHTIAEAAGLVYAGTLFPELDGAADWRRTGLDLLCSEARRQVLADGGGAEQSFWYLRFVVELCELVAALLAHRGEQVPAELGAAVARGHRFLLAMADDDGALFDVGDRDDGRALGPWFAPATPPSGSRQMLATFPEAGYTRLRAGGLDVLIDHGRLGMAPLYGHGHADALSVIVRGAGRELLLDPGTYTYNGDPAWRRYFRSTAAHNTVSVDGQDQAVQEGAFAWSRPYACKRVELEESPGCVRLLARHDGYGRLGAIHWRGIALREAGLLVWDCVTGTGAHEVQVNWHAPGAVRAGAGRWTLADGALLEITGAEGVRECRGEAPDAGGGWRSARYGSKAPLSAIRATTRGALPREVTSFIRPGGGGGGGAQDGAIAGDVATFRRWQAG